MSVRIQREGRYRVWLVRSQRGSLGPLGAAPRQLVAVEPAEETLMTASQAGEYVAAYNAAALVGESGLWAIAVPVTILYEGDLRPGRPLAARVVVPQALPRRA
jgi:hypothetical protein